MVPRYLVLVDGCFNHHHAKFAIGVLRYRPETIAALLDPQTAGRSVQQVIGIEHPAPIVATLEEGLASAPTHLLIGINPTGGALPPAWRETIVAALRAGLEVVAGLHTLLGDDLELAAEAARQGRQLIDLRRPPAERTVADRRVLGTRARRILTVGTDCAVGKMTASLELVAAARRDGLDARFLATGQTGIAIADDGIPLDAIVGDFMAGAVESLVLRAADSDLVVIEGQGSLYHPGYSSVTLALLHGGLPDAMILCHEPTMTELKGARVRIPPLPEVIALHETVMAAIRPCPVVGINLMTPKLSDAEARLAIEETTALTGLPTTDTVRFGAAPLAGAWRAR